MCANCHWEDVLDTLYEMLNDDDYTYRKAHRFLESVTDWIEVNKHVTTAQHAKVMEIKAEYGS